MVNPLRQHRSSPLFVAACVALLFSSTLGVRVTVDRADGHERGGGFGSSCSSAVAADFASNAIVDANFGSSYNNFLHANIPTCNGIDLVDSPANPLEEWSVWYTMVGSDFTVTVDTCSSDAFADGYVLILSGDCGSLACVTANDGSGCSGGFGARASAFLTRGVTYYFVVVNTAELTGTSFIFDVAFDAPDFTLVSATPAVLSPGETLTLTMVEYGNSVDNLAVTVGGVSCGNLVRLSATSFTCTIALASPYFVDGAIVITSTDVSGNAVTTGVTVTVVGDFYGSSSNLGLSYGAVPRGGSVALYSGSGVSPGATMSGVSGLSNDFGFDVWFENWLPTMSGRYVLAAHSVADTFEFSLVVDGPARTMHVELKYGPGLAGSLTSQTAPVDGELHWAAFRFGTAAGATVVYLDGSSTVAPSAPSAPLPSSAGTLNMAYLTGRIAELRLWSSAAPATTFASLMSTPVAGSESGLAAAFTFSPTLDDLSPNGAVITLDAEAVVIHKWRPSASPCAGNCGSCAASLTTCGVCKDNTRTDLVLAMSCFPLTTLYATAVVDQTNLANGANWVPYLLGEPKAAPTVDFWESPVGGADVTLSFANHLRAFGLRHSYNAAPLTGLFLSSSTWAPTTAPVAVSWLPAQDASSVRNFTVPPSTFVDTVRLTTSTDNTKLTYVGLAGVPPASCLLAQPLTLNGEPVTGSTRPADLLSSAWLSEALTCSAPSSASIAAAPALWFTFEGTGEEVRLSACRSAVPVEVVVLEGSCYAGCLTWATFATSPEASCSGGSSPSITLATTEGVTYYVRLAATQEAPAGGSVSLALTSNAVPVVGSPFSLTKTVHDSHAYSADLSSELPANIAWRFADAPWSYTMWFKPSLTAPTVPTLLASLAQGGPSSTAVFRMDYGRGSARNQLRITMDIGGINGNTPLSTQVILETPAIVPGEWVHIALVYESSTTSGLTVFFDGEPVATTNEFDVDYTLVGRTTTDLNRLYRFGEGMAVAGCCCAVSSCDTECFSIRRGGGSSHFLHFGEVAGSYDDLRLYARALTAGELADSIMDSQVSVADPDLVAAFPIDEEAVQSSPGGGVSLAPGRLRNLAAAAATSRSDALLRRYTCGDDEGLDGVASEALYQSDPTSFDGVVSLGPGAPLNVLREFREDESLLLTVSGYDVDGDALTYQVVSAPDPSSMALCDPAAPSYESAATCTALALDELPATLGSSDVLAKGGPNAYGLQTFEIVAVDSLGATSTVPAERAVLVVGVNDAPTLVRLLEAESETEDPLAPVTIGDVALTVNLQLTDVDGDVAPLTAVIDTQYGSVTLASTLNVFFEGAQSATHIEFSGTVERVAAALAGLTYRRLPTEFTFTDTLAVVVTDNNNDQLDGSASATFELTIHSDAAFVAANTEVVLPLPTVHAFTEFSFDVQLHDAYSNPTTTATGAVVSVLSCLGNPCANPSALLSDASPASDNGDGSYTFTDTISAVTTVFFEFFVDGEYQPTMSVRAVVRPAQTSVELSTIEGFNATERTTELDFVITAVNVFGSPQTTGGDEWVVAIRPGEIEVAVVDNGDGTYAVQYSFSEGGDYVLEIFLKVEGVAVEFLAVDIVVPVICQAGQRIDGDVCADCVPGTVGNGLSTECALCLAGSMANSPTLATQCLVCEAGHVARFDGATACEPCQSDTFPNAEVGGTGCRDCPCNSATFGQPVPEGPESCGCRSGYYGSVNGVSLTCIARERAFFGLASSSSSASAEEPGSPDSESFVDVCESVTADDALVCCRVCPEHADCPGGRSPPVAHPGYWMQESINSETGEPEFSLFVCDPPEACPGGAAGTCAEGYAGDRCGSCLSNSTHRYYSLSGVCTECAQTSGFLWFLCVPFIIIALIYVMTTKGSSDPSSVAGAFGIIMTFFQFVTLFASLRVPWPAELRALFANLSFFNFNFDVMAPECELESFSYWNKNLLKLFIPLMLIWCALIAVTCLGVYYACCRKRLNERAAIARRYHDSRYSSRGSSSDSEEDYDHDSEDDLFELDDLKKKAANDKTSSLKKVAGTTTAGASGHSRHLHSSGGYSDTDSTGDHRRRRGSDDDGDSSSRSSKNALDKLDKSSSSASDQGSEWMAAHHSTLTQRFLSASLMCMTVTYTLVVSVVLDPFRCTYQPNLDSPPYTMTAQPSEKCYDTQWRKKIPISIVAALVYVFGVPILFVALLIYNRHNLKDSKVLMTLGGIYRNFNGKWYWWEASVMFRKALYVIFIVFIPSPIWQVTLCIILILVSLIAQVYARPYQLMAHNRLEFASMLTTLLILLMGVIVQTDSFASSPSNSTALLVIVGTLLCLCVLVFAQALVVVAYYKALRVYYQHWAHPDEIIAMSDDKYRLVFGEHDVKIRIHKREKDEAEAEAAEEENNRRAALAASGGSLKSVAPKRSASSLSLDITTSEDEVASPAVAAGGEEDPAV